MIESNNQGKGAGLGQGFKYTADYIFDGYRLRKGALLHLNAAGEVLGLIDSPDAHNLKGATHFAGILCPGLINAHCHLELSHLKGAIEKKTGLPGFAQKVMGLRSFPKEEITAALELADNKMWENGIQAVGDICNTTDSLAKKQQTKILYRNFIECLGFLPEQAAARFNYAYKVWEQFYQVNPASSLVPHAPYSVSAQLFAKINQSLSALPGPEKRIISMHNQESAPENEFFRTGRGEFIDFYKNMGIDLGFYKPSGKSSLQTVLPYLGVADSNLLLVHNTFMDKADLAFALNQAKSLNMQLYFVLCPGANLYIENRLPDILMLLGAGVNLALGTDSLASNDQLSIAREMQHILQAHPALSKETLLSWATLSGARALGFEKLLGSFENGKNPGVVLLSEELDLIKRIL
ncbi:amidohydrolase family protein [Arachidicoccus ginsenosidivorans]|uniref:Amidohydrolase family protein n=1 Tax=Arachidicoccus ginsenosidivorans TaxID=496057 RepID=A0A5B8VK23_9BACT|nr:amidohydrolase family protein [Arachidicoccus ginsenosidivorans]QEC71830.1 amidohydrolase family protein [Arachidicoccus ginsenosidivorans]